MAGCKFLLDCLKLENMVLALGNNSIALNFSNVGFENNAKVDLTLLFLDYLPAFKALFTTII